MENYLSKGDNQLLNLLAVKKVGKSRFTILGMVSSQEFSILG